jgi:hypothetical protein
MIILDWSDHPDIDDFDDDYFAKEGGEGWSAEDERRYQEEARRIEEANWRLDYPEAAAERDAEEGN